MSAAITAVVVGAGSIAAADDASRQARHASEDAAEDVRQSSINNAKFMARQGRAAAEELGRGADKSLSRFKKLPRELRNLIDPRAELVEGAYDQSTAEAFDPSLAEEGGMADFVGSSVESDVMSKFANESPAVMREISRLSNIEGRKANASQGQFRDRFSNMETGFRSDLSNIEAVGAERIAQILSTTPKAQANAMIGTAGQAMPFIESGQEAAALSKAAGQVSKTNQMNQLSNILGQAL